jgi:hypothetical protein
MPKIKSSLKSKLDSYVKSKSGLKVENEKVFCMICVKHINVTESKYKCRIDEHLSSDYHKKRKDIEEKRQQTIGEAFDNHNNHNNVDNYFKQRLTEAMIESNIPLHKLNVKPFKEFLQEFTGRQIPSESTLRKGYIEPLYKKIIDKIRDIIGSNYVYFMIDESHDSCDRKVFNVLVGVLNGEYSKPMLMDMKFIDNTTHSTIQTTFMDCCQTLWPKGIPYDKVLLLVTDAAPYMVLSANNLKTFFTNMSHITCVVHGLDRVCRVIQENCQQLNKFIACMKKCLLNSNSKQMLYKEVTGLPLPPNPIITRWNTWMETALYYRENYTLIKNFVDSLNSDSKTYSTKKIKCLINNSEFKNQLFGINDYKIIVESINRLLDPHLSLAEQKSIIDNTFIQLNGYPKEKLEKVLKKNKDLESFCNNEDFEKRCLTAFAPIVSVEIERSFSRYKHILSDRRHSFTENSLKMQLIIQFNEFLNE